MPDGQVKSGFNTGATAGDMVTSFLVWGIVAHPAAESIQNLFFLIVF
jgi:hypothetical protein